MRCSVLVVGVFIRETGRIDGKMYKLKFLVFALYDLAYKNADRHADAVRIVFVLVLYQFMFLIMVFGVTDRLLNFSVIAFVKGVGTTVCLIPLFFLNYRYFISKSGFESLCGEYDNADINSKKNRKLRQSPGS